MQQSEIGGSGDEARAQRARLFARSTPPHTIRPWPLPRAQSQTIEALRRELADAPEALRTEVVAQFRDQVAQSGTPLIEECDDGASTLFTFVWFGQAPHGVVVQLNRITDTLDVEDTKLEQIEGSEVYALTLRLPSNWLGSYMFVPPPSQFRPRFTLVSTCVSLPGWRGLPRQTPTPASSSRAKQWSPPERR